MNAQKDISQCLEWIQNHAPDALDITYAEPHINKAGILPIYKKKVLLIKPHAKKKHLGAPPWQLIKGTRMLHSADGWQDYDDVSQSPDVTDLEPLLCTALREGMEEAGLKLENISFVGLLGEHRYRSLSSGKEKTMQLFALGIEDKTLFDWPDDDHAVTETMQWFHAKKLPENTRDDVAHAIEQVTADW